MPKADWESGCCAVDVPGAWPYGVKCRICSSPLRKGEKYLARVFSQGLMTVAFHRYCIVGLVNERFPESMWEEIRDRIIAADGNPFNLEYS